MEMELIDTSPMMVTPASYNSVEALIKNLRAANLGAKSEELLRVYTRKLRLKLEQKGRWRFIALSSTHQGPNRIYYRHERYVSH